MRVDDFLSLLSGVKQTGPSQWMALCPAHDDKNPSLSIQAVDDRILVHCFAGCSPEEIVRAMGLEMKDLFIDNGDIDKGDAGIPQAYYVYQDEHGNPLYRVVRYYVPDSGKKKTFRQEAYDPETGEWRREKGIMARVRKVPYRLPEIINSPRDVPIWLCEGEKDVEHLRLYGLVATTNSGGARGWRAEYNRYFIGRTVYILQDNDPEGERRATQLAEQLHGIAKDVKIVDLPGLGAKQDVSDWLLQGHTIDELKEIAANTPSYQPRTAAILKGDAGIYNLEWPELGIQAEVEILSESYGDYYVLISVYVLGKRILPPTKVNLLSLSTRGKLAKELEGKQPLGMWDSIVDNLATRILDKRAEGEPLSIETSASTFEDTRYLVHPVLPLGLPAVIYGDGESGKTLTSILIGVLVSTGESLPGLGLQVQTRGPVLYLDYESNRDVFARRLVRLSKGLGLDPVIHYLHCSVPLAQDIKRVSKVVLEVDPLLIIVDSAALAALPGAKDPLDTVKSIITPLSQLGRTSLIIAHTPKGGDSIYGSIFFRNLARSVWHAQAYQTIEDPYLDVVLTHNKSNEDQHFAPLALRYSFLQDRIVVKRSNPVDLPDVKLPAEVEIYEFLRQNGAYSPKAIADELGIKPGTVRKALKKMKETGKIVRLPDGRYGAAAREREEDVVPF